jgi:hemerythrin-like metal-binding protein
MKQNEENANSNRLAFLEQNVFIVWKPDYDLGIPIIDEQHRGIVAIINSLHYGMQNGYIKEMFEAIVDMANRYTLIHFRVEEDIYAKAEYPGREHHHDMHNALMMKQTEIGKKCLAEKDPYQLMDFLKKWWINHICNQDMHFKDYLQTLTSE